MLLLVFRFFFVGQLEGSGKIGKGSGRPVANVIESGSSIRDNQF